MKIKLKQNIDGIMALSKMCSNIIETQSNDLDVKVVQSVINDVSKLVTKAYNNALENHNMFNVKKLYTITLKFHEAYAVHQSIIVLIETVNNPLAKSKLNQIKDFINRKMV